MKNFIAFFVLMTTTTVAFADLASDATEAFLSNAEVQSEVTKLKEQGCYAQNKPNAMYVAGHTGDPGVFRHVLLVAQNFVCRAQVDYFKGAVLTARVSKIHWDTNLPDAVNFIVELADFSKRDPLCFGSSCTF